MTRCALVIGRFQPLHNGHLATLRRAADVADEITVVVGSAQKSHLTSDPFTAGERIVMVRDTAQAEGLPVRQIVPVPDLDQYHLWVEQVRAWTPPFDVVVTGSPMTAHLFAQAGVDVERVHPVDRERLSGTALRARIARHDSVTREVPTAVARLLGRDDVQARFRAMHSHEEGHG